MTDRLPIGSAGRCFRALAALDGRASTTQIRLYLACGSAPLDTAQVRTSLHSLARRSSAPLVELAEPGTSGYGRPGVWQLTRHGHVAWAQARGARVPCGTGWPR